MRGLKKAVLLVLILSVVFQFVQPVKNKSEGISENDISRTYEIPKEVHATLIEKCYDCHSNNTRYPWYFNIQPIGWWLAAHVHDGKENINFSEFRNYTPKKEQRALEELEEVVEEGSMPLKAYVTFHPGSEITPDDKKAILNWLANLKRID
jgi:hypothetical protein